MNSTRNHSHTASVTDRENRAAADLAFQAPPALVDIGETAPAARKLTDLPVALLRMIPSVQKRALGKDYNVIAEYAESLRVRNWLASAPFPIVAFESGPDYIVADGFHRIPAAMQAGIEIVPVDVRQGTLRDAELFAAGSNQGHGLKRSHADKHNAVMTLLQDAEWSQWSDRQIAAHVGMSDKTVAAIRLNVSRCGISAPENDSTPPPADPPAPAPSEPEPETNRVQLSELDSSTQSEPTSAPPPAPPKRLGKDGKLYPAAKPAAKPAAPHPGAEAARGVLGAMSLLQGETANLTRRAMQAALVAAHALRLAREHLANMTPDDQATLLRNIDEARAAIQGGSHA